MTEKLLPCPFCGGEAKLFCEDGGHWVICQSCGSKALTHYDSLYPTTARKRAIAAWNRRSDAVPVVRGEWEIAIGYDPNKKVQCQNCYKMAYEPTPYCPNCGAKMEDKP